MLRCDIEQILFVAGQHEGRAHGPSPSNFLGRPPALPPSGLPGLFGGRLSGGHLPDAGGPWRAVRGSAAAARLAEQCRPVASRGARALVAGAPRLADSSAALHRRHAPGRTALIEATAWIEHQSAAGFRPRRRSSWAAIISARDTASTMVPMALISGVTPRRM